MSSKAEKISEAGPKKRYPLPIEVVVRLVKEKPLGTVGGVIVLIMFITGIFADVLAPYGVNEVNMEDTFSQPSIQYPLGTDHLGRDMLSRIIHGARISMIVGLAGASLCVFMAVVIGVPSGFFGGKFDLIVQRFVDARMCFPALLLYLTVMSILGRGLLQVIFVLGFFRGIGNSRVVRSAVISIKENVYVDAAEAIGCSPWRILTRHILPNITAPLIIIFTISMGGMIISEATISFLGFGIPPPLPSWGGMLSGKGRLYMLTAPWLAIWPGMALTVVVWGINMLGDGMRDILDPRLRGGLGRYGRVKTEKK